MLSITKLEVKNTVLKKTNNLGKKIGIRIIFYSLVLSLLWLIPIIYEKYFLTYGIEMLLFMSYPYVMGELFGISIIVFLAEYYLFTKLIKIEIEDKWWKFKVSCGLVLLLFFIGKFSLYFCKG